MEKIKNKAIDCIEWIAALTLITAILLALMFVPGIIELLL